MLKLRPAAERGRTKLDWLDSRHSFSFNEYYDPAWSCFRSLRVINDDYVAPGAGFPTHGHRDMEILTWVLDGALEHRDSMGNGSTLKRGEMQRMSAGSGVTHSEFNYSGTDALRLLQIWILPWRRGIEPGYEQKPFPLEERLNRFRLVASSSAQDGSLLIHQDASVYVANPEAGVRLAREIAPGRHAWVQIARGAVIVNGVEMREGDGLAASEERTIEISATQDSELLLFDLA